MDTGHGAGKAVVVLRTPAARKALAARLLRRSPTSESATDSTTATVADVPAPRPSGDPGPPRRGLIAPYRRILSVPGALAFTLAGLIARLPMSMLGVATVAMIATVRDSYALAGAVSATAVTVTALTAPLGGRLVDRYGQARVVLIGLTIFACGTTAMLLCIRQQAPDWALFVCCLGSCGAPGIGSMTRARWAELFRDDAASRHTANSLEQVLDEFSFTVGPALAMVLSTTLFPEAGLVCALVLVTVGTVLFAAQRRTEPPARRPEPGSRATVFGLPGLGVVCGVFVATGVVFGAMEVSSVAVVDAFGGGATGAVLAFQAAGSCVAGVVFGGLTLRGPLVRRFALGVAAMALGVLPLVVADGLVVLALLLFLAGLATAPTMISGMTLVQRLVPAGRLNEGMNTAYTGLLVGISAGAALAGQVVDGFGANRGYLVPATAGALALAVALAGSGRLRAALARRPA